MREGRSNLPNRLCGRKIGIYTGSGTSHSWLWFVEIMEKAGIDDLVFIDDGDIKNEAALKNIDILLLSGGDTFSIARGMQVEGSRNVERFITEGGVYFGSCAGAYLPMRSSKYPLNLLNLAGIKIKNLSKSIPASLPLSDKFCTPYGCDYVFHPIREEVKLRFSNDYSSGEREEIKAPLYGGPCMEKSDDVKPIAFYNGFTDNTLFLVEESLARETVLGKMAVCSKEIGRGKLYLSGPHLEHPHYPEANQLLFEMLADGNRNKTILCRHDEAEGTTEISRDCFRELKRELSGARMIALALEREHMAWLIGQKVYEPEKFRVFIDALWSRIGLLENSTKIGFFGDIVCSFTASAKEVKERLRRLKSEIHTSLDTAGLAGEIIDELRKLSSTFMNLYFAQKRRVSRQEGKSYVHVL